MKVLGVLCLAAYAVCILASGYVPGKEYVYKYKGKIFAEKDKQHHQHSGLVLKSEVHVQSKDNSLLFKIDHVVYDKVNARVDKRRGYDFTFHKNDNLSNFLGKPFQVFFEHGLIHHIVVSDKDPQWSVNMKLGLAELFQLNFEQRNAVHDEQNTQPKEPDLEAHYFKVPEASIYGVCDTMYQVGQDASPLVDHDTPILNVTKSIDFDHCSKLSYYMYQSMNYDTCIDPVYCKADATRAKRLSNVLRYSLHGDRQNYVIEKVHAESEFTHLPWTHLGEMANIHTNRTLLLIESRDAVDDIKVADETVTHTDLHFQINRERGFQEVVDLKAPHFLYNFLGTSAAIVEVGESFNELVSPLIDDSFPEKFQERQAPYKFVEIVKLISTMSYDNIERVFNDYVVTDNPVEIFIRTQLFFEILSSAGTNPAFMFAKEHIEDKRVISHVAAYFIKMLPFTIKESSESLFDEIQDLCNNKLHNHPHLERFCYLAFSSIIYQECVGKNYLLNKRFPNFDGPKCTPELAKKYYDHVIGHFEDEHEDDEVKMITGIKTTGNFGLKEGIAHMKKYIDNDHYPTYFRVAAILSLRRIALTDPKAVLEELAPVYFNLSEGHEVRTAAFGILMLANPPRSLLEAIGVSLHGEHNHQVVSFVSSAFYYFAHSHYPCHKAIKGDMEHVLRHVMRLDSLPQFDFKHSRYWMSSGYNKEFGFGGMSSIGYVTSNDSYVPHIFFAGTKDYLMDKSIEPFTVIINQEGLDKFLDRIFGPDGLFKENESILDTASVEKELNEIDSSLHIKPRHGRKVRGDISFRIFGHETTFIYFNETLLDNMIRNDFSIVPYLQGQMNLPSFAINSFYMERYAVIIVPTPLGLPSFMLYQEPGYVYYKNKELSFEFSPSVFAKDTKNDAPKTLHVSTKGHLIYENLLRSAMGITVFFDSSTFGVGHLSRSYLNKPLDVNLNVDLKHFKMDLKMTGVENHDLCYLSSTPFTFIGNYKIDIDTAVEDGYLPYYKPDEMEEFHENYLHDYLGYGLNVTGRYGKLNIFRSRENAYKFFTEHSLRDVSYILHANPHVASYELDISVTAAENEPTNEVDIHLEFDHHDLVSNKKLDSTVYDHHQDIEEHAKEHPGRTFHAYIVKASVDRKGPKERKVVIEGAYTYSCNHKLHKYSLYYDRSPHRAGETEHFKICGNVYMRYPDYDVKKLHDLDTLELDEKIHALAKIGFGKDCKNDKHVTITGTLSRTKEQLDLEHKREEVDHLHYNPYAYFYKKCKEEHARGAHYDYHCRRYIALSTIMNHYDIDVDIETEMTKEFVNNTRKLFSWLENDLYYYKDQNFIPDESQKKLDFFLNFSPVEDTVDIEILRPLSTAHFNNVPLNHVYSPLSASPYLRFTNNIRINRFFQPSLCSIEGDYITTFDNVTFHLPEIDCWKVLAKDCSEHELFLILGKKVTNPNYPKALKLFLGKIKVEILPVTDTTEPIVRVNGKKVDVTKISRYLYHPEGHEGEPIFYVKYNGFYYTIDSHDYGVTVYYDGKAIVSQISSYYKGKQCGLCGDYNHEHDNELRGPEDCVYHSIEDFAAAYSIHEDGCLAPEINKKPCEIPDVH